MYTIPYSWVIQQIKYQYPQHFSGQLEVLLIVHEFLVS